MAILLLLAALGLPVLVHRWLRRPVAGTFVVLGLYSLLVATVTIVRQLSALASSTAPSLGADVLVGGLGDLASSVVGWGCLTIPASVLSGFLAALVLREKPPAAGSGACGFCGYDLTGLALLDDQTCPECGSRDALSSDRSAARRSR